MQQTSALTYGGAYGANPMPQMQQQQMPQQHQMQQQQQPWGAPAAGGYSSATATSPYPTSQLQQQQMQPQPYAPLQADPYGAAQQQQAMASSYPPAPGAAPNFSGMGYAAAGASPQTVAGGGGHPYLQQAAPPPPPPPPALNATDNNGLRWTWSTYPSVAALAAAANPAEPGSPAAGGQSLAAGAAQGVGVAETASHGASALLHGATGMISKVGGRARGSARRNPYFPLPPGMVIPLSCMFQPLMPLADPDGATVREVPTGLQCANCGAFCSLHSVRQEGHWVCLSCQRKYPLPPTLSPQHPLHRYETVEYVVGQSLPPPPQGYTPAPVGVAAAAGGAIPGPPPPVPGVRDPLALVLLVDTCVRHTELEALKQRLVSAFQWIPPSTLIAFMTVGRSTAVWELGNPCFSRCYTLRGDKELNYRGYSRALQVKSGHATRGRFFVPLQEGWASLHNLVESLAVDNEPVPSPFRPSRTTGTAVAVATFLLEALTPLPSVVADAAARERSGGKGSDDITTPTVAPLPSHAVAGEHVPGRVLLFTGGPCTRGGGTVASKKKEDLMRFHRDIVEGNTPFLEAATKFFQGLAGRLSYVNACLDVFAQSYDQVGVLELRCCVDSTGGSMICGDAFDHENFYYSLQRYVLRTGICSADTMMDFVRRTSGDDAAAEAEEWILSNAGTCGSAVEVEVYTMHGDLMVVGVVGPCVAAAAGGTAAGPPGGAGAMKKHVALIPALGVANGSNRWFASLMQQDVTLGMIFDTPSSEVNTVAAALTGGSHRFIQFVTRYVSIEGERRVRVTSVLLPISPPHAPAQYFAQGATFDQTCAATMMARMAAFAMEKHPGQWDLVRRALDDVLISFVARFATYTVGSEDSVRLDPSLSLFPIFLFNLRRSEYFMVLNISPDETTFKRHWLMREPVDRCVLMIQPTLYAYDITAPSAAAVPLDSSSLREDNIVLMDAYFNIHIMWGATIYEWIKAKYHENPEYENFAELLSAAENDAQLLLAQRFPYPRFSRTDANGSEARHVKTRVNPAQTYVSSGPSMAADPYSLAYGSVQAVTEKADVINTDDTSISKFMASLKRAVTAEAPKEKNVKDAIVESASNVTAFLKKE